MIKGVNHQIIEINQTDNPYFERALLFVSPSCASETEELLQDEGKQFVKSAESYSEIRSIRTVRWVKRVILLLIGALCGTGLGLFLAINGLY